MRKRIIISIVPLTFAVTKSMPARIVTSLLLVLFSSVAVRSEGEYGVGEVSECAEGFASPYHIDAVEGNTERHDHDERQVVIPDITFSCSGTIRKWILGATWEDNPAAEAHIELQIWRRSSGSVYTKVGSTTLMIRRENDSQFYEYPLETPLAFQEGDILGYFQPEDDSSDMALYLEYSKRIRGYHNIVTALESPGTFDINNADAPDSHYPLIHVETDPPGCGCGFMSVERMYRILGLTPFSTGLRGSYSQQQLIFPDIRFTCSGVLVKWIMGGKWNEGDGRNEYPDLQIWRPLGYNTYTRVHSTTISVAVKREDNVYEFEVSPPIPFQPGDILGVFQPWSGRSRLQVDFDSSGRSVNFYTSIGSDQVEPFQNTIDTDGDQGLITNETLPLVSVEIVAANQTSILHSSSTISTMMSASQHVITIRSLIPSNTTPTAILSAVISQSPPRTQDGDGSSDGVSIDSLSLGVGVAGTSIVFISAVFITITALVCLRRRNNEVCLRRRNNEATNTINNKAYLSGTSDMSINAAYVATSNQSTTPSDGIYTYVAPPASTVPTTTIKAYMTTNILPSSNQAYQECQYQNGTH